MKKIGTVLLYIFAVGAILCLLAGALSLVGFIVALCIGGEIATEISVFVHKEYFPIVIQVTSIFCAIGLLGMYFNKISALSIKSTAGTDEAPEAEVAEVAEAETAEAEAAVEDTDAEDKADTDKE